MILIIELIAVHASAFNKELNALATNVGTFKFGPNCPYTGGYKLVLNSSIEKTQKAHNATKGHT